ncbi:MAG: hypothetical protein HC807_02200, partial [Gammaproteobacteria bacterium]|nr:hypothetical protein [Gammaproteobacteria bacterium]
MQVLGRPAAAARGSRVIDNQQASTRLQRRVQLVEETAGVDGRPAARLVDVVKVVIRHHDQDQVEATLAELHVAGLDRALRDLGHAAIVETHLQFLAGEILVRGIVDQGHLAAGSDRSRQQFTPVAAATEDIGDGHAGPDAGKGHGLG